MSRCKRLLPSSALLPLFAVILPWMCAAQVYPVAITATSGINQTALFNNAFAQPLVVTLTDNLNNPSAGQTVTFSGDGIVTTTARTGPDGKASAIVTAGSTLGGYTVSANVSGFVPIDTSEPYGNVGFSLTAVFTLTDADAACSPSTNVTTTGDPTSGSLRQALADVCPGGTVDLSNLATPATITLQSRLYLNQDVKILGPATGTVTISGNNATRIFFVQSGDVTIANLTLANGYGKGDDGEGVGAGAGMGGAIFQNGGNLTLTNVSLSGNQAVGGSEVTPTSGCSGGFGGGFGCAGDLGGAGHTSYALLPNFTNGADGGDGEPGGAPSTYGPAGAGGFGGGGGEGDEEGGSGGFGAGGGGGGLGGGGGYGGGSGYAQSLFQYRSGAAAGFGGAIFERNGTLTLNDVTFSGNRSVAGTSGGNNSSPGQAKGGALFVYYGATAQLTNVTFANNAAPDAGKPGIGNSLAPYLNGATCPGTDDVNTCGQAPSISASPSDATQTVFPGGAFTPLSVTVSDGSGNPVNGVSVTFIAPSSGASGVFSNGANKITVQTVNGVATVPFTANSTSGGPYTVTATANGLTQTFSLTNSAQFIIGQTPGPVRNDYTGFVGMELTVGPAGATAYSLGRFVIAGNTQTHIVKLVQANGTDVPNGSVSVPTPGATAGTYQYVALAAPVTLLANTSYFLVSQETAGGDQWYNYGPVTSAPIATVVAPVYTDGQGHYVPVTALPGNAYVPVSFLAAPPTTSLSVTITSPAANATLSGTASISVSTTGPVSSLQVQGDGVNQGSAVPVSVGQSSYTLSLNTTVLSAGTHSLTVIASDASSDVAVSGPVSINVNNATAGSSTPFVLGEAPGPLRNNYTGFVGLSLTVGSTPVVVSSLGRYVAPVNSGAHLLKLVNSDGTDVAGGSVSVSLLGATAGTFQYGALAAPVTLQANSSYYVVSQETVGGDEWYDYGAVVTSVVASVNGPTYTDGQGHYVTVAGAAGDSYVPVSFLYGGSATTALSATITSPQSGASVSGNVQVAVSTAGAFTSLQLQVDGVNTGAPVAGSPIALNTTTLSNGQHTLTVVISNGGSTAVSAGVAVTVNNGGSVATTAFTTGQTAGALRNNYTGFVGMTIQVGSTPISVVSLGRFVVAGNNGTHVVKLVQANGTDVPGGAATLTLGAGDAPGQYAYAMLPAVVALSANTTYYLVSQETVGGDMWYDLEPITTTGVAQVTGPTYTDGRGNYVTVGGFSGNSYVPLSFQYQ